MKAMILAAGLGTRLLPLTENKPKALIEINGHSLLEICIKKLAEANFDDIIINIHHHSDMVIEYLKRNNNFGARITISDERNELLDSGGGILKASDWLSDGSFLVYNVDILSNIDLNSLYNKHIESGTLATLAVRDRITSRYLLFDNSSYLRGWINEKENLIKINKGYDFQTLRKMAFSGIQVISPEFFSLLSESGKFSIIDAYLRLSENERILAYEHNKDTWLDVGKHESLKDAAQFIT